MCPKLETATSRSRSGWPHTDRGRFKLTCRGVGRLSDLIYMAVGIERACVHVWRRMRNHVTVNYSIKLSRDDSHMHVLCSLYAEPHCKLSITNFVSLSPNMLEVTGFVTTMLHGDLKSYLKSHHSSVTWECPMSIKTRRWHMLGWSRDNKGYIGVRIKHCLSR